NVALRRSSCLTPSPPHSRSTLFPYTTLFRSDEGIYTRWSSPQPMCWYYRDYRLRHGLINGSKAIEVSCNYFFYEEGYQVGIDTLADYAGRFGLGQKTGLELAEKEGDVGSTTRSEELSQEWYNGNV